MKTEQDGSKAMTIYIVACFALAVAALVGHKYMDEKRVELADDYVDVAMRYTELRHILAPDLIAFYNSERTPVTRAQRDRTHTDLENLGVERVRLTRAAPRGGISVSPRTPANARGRGEIPDHVRFGCEVELKGVTHAQWTQYLREALAMTSSYGHVSQMQVVRSDRNIRNLRVLPSERTRDGTLWDVKIEFVWFGPTTPS